MNNNSISIFCDESCHLQCDSGPMALGAIVVPTNKVRKHNILIRQIKERHGIKKDCEMKWTKISPSKKNVYIELINYFFSEEDLTFRAVLIKNKTGLNHGLFNQTHDDWYYKMYFQLLNNLLNTKFKNKIFLDIKDTKSAIKVRKLHEILCNVNFDFDRDMVSSIQNIRSQEIELMSITDVFIGALTYYHRNLRTSTAKLEMIDTIKNQTKLSFDQSSLLSEKKFNLFVWTPQEGM